MKLYFIHCIISYLLFISFFRLFLGFIYLFFVVLFRFLWLNLFLVFLLFLFLGGYLCAFMLFSIIILCFIFVDLLCFFRYSLSWRLFHLSLHRWKYLFSWLFFCTGFFILIFFIKTIFRSQVIWIKVCIHVDSFFRCWFFALFLSSRHAH